MVSDEFLLHKYVGSGDPGAFRELIRRYAGLVYGTSLRILNNADAAADVAQECFIELSRSAGAIRSSLPGWLHRVARSRSLNAIRDESTRRRYEAQAASEAAPTAEPQWKDVALCLDEAVDALPDELRSAIVLYYLRGLSQSEVAEELGLNRSTVSRHLDKGLDLLREQLKGAGIVAPAAVLAALVLSNRSTAVPSELVSELNAIPAAAPVGSGVGMASALAAFIGTAVGKIVALLVIAGLVGGGIAASHYVNNRGGVTMDPRQIPGVASAIGDGEHTATMAVEDFATLAPTNGDGFLGCLSAVLAQRGVTISDDEILGLSGAAFRIGFWMPDWCPSSTDLLGGFDHTVPLLQALGFEHSLLIPVSLGDPNGPAGVAARADGKWREAIVRNIDAGWPVIAASWEESCQYGVITGYLDGGRRWIGRKLGDTSGSYAVSVYEPYNILIIGRKTSPMDPRAALRRSLEIAIELANTKAYYRDGSQTSGFAAYDAWIAALAKLGDAKPEEYIADANYQIYTSLVQDRSAAANYLTNHAADLGPDAKPHILRVAELYRKIAVKLEAEVGNLPASLGADKDGTKHYDTGQWTQAMRQKQITVLREVVTLERQAIQEIEQALKATR